MRERKKQRTRDKIVEVALELFAERGYEHTTLNDIAEAADISPRTIFGYFDSKEDILFADDSEFLEEVTQRLERRGPGVSTVDALREFVGDLRPPDANGRLLTEILEGDEALRPRLRARTARVEQLIAESVAKDLDSPPDDIRPLLVAAAAAAALQEVRVRAATGTLTPEQAQQLVDEVLEFLSGGIEALRRRPRAGLAPTSA